MFQGEAPTPSVSEAFAAVLGRPTWSAVNGHGSWLTLDFGEPLLSVDEPKMAPVFIDGAASRTLQRRARVHGTWWLWIHLCEWQLSLHGIPVAHYESDKARIDRALAVVAGQSLVGVDFDQQAAKCTFAFDLGCVLRTCPAPAGTYDDEPVDQWTLFMPAATTFTLLCNGAFSIEAQSMTAIEN